MNYPFRSAIIDFAKGKISSKEFSRAVMTIAENYPLGSLSCAMNSLSTHDTVRILNALSDVPVPQNKHLRAHFALSGEDLKSARRLEKACAFLQFTLPGNPCIYYGDEIGMQGYEDPLNRGYFKWNSIDTELFEFYKNLSKIKNTCKAVTLGNIEFISLSERGLSFLRKYGNQEVTVEISLDGKAVNTENAIFYFSEENISFSICHKK
jgi:4-alpha-glucanotransferase